ncbi:hypothetical protein ACG97_03035 [Vogesella sp. EB]|nr:hypothetical protein ACG97_03035 [Vogesella sp. EB]
MPQAGFLAVSQGLGEGLGCVELVLRAVACLWYLGGALLMLSFYLTAKPSGGVNSAFTVKAVKADLFFIAF